MFEVTESNKRYMFYGCRESNGAYWSLASLESCYMNFGFLTIAYFANDPDKSLIESCVLDYDFNRLIIERCALF